MTAVVIAVTVVLIGIGAVFGWTVWPHVARRRRLRQRIQSVAQRLRDRRGLGDVDYPFYEGALVVEAWLIQGLPTNALEAATKAVQEEPRDPARYFHLARALYHCGEPQAALKALGRSAQLGTESAAHRYLMARILLDLARRSGKRLSRERLIRLAHEMLDILEENPGFGDPALLVWEVMEELGMAQEAAALRERALPLVQLSPDLLAAQAPGLAHGWGRGA